MYKYSRDRPIAIAIPAAVVLLLVGALMSPGPPANAAPPPTKIPEVVYRTDSRGPDEIFVEGFRAGEWVNGAPVNPILNDNVLDHVGSIATWSDDPASQFVSTTADALLANSGQGVTSPGHWVYKITPAENFHSADRALAEAMKSPHADIAERARALDREVGFQSEWLAKGGIPAAHIEWAKQIPETEFEYYDSQLLPDSEWLEFLQSETGREVNPTFAAPTATPTLDPYPVSEVSFGRGPSCLSKGLGLCGFREAMNDRELMAFHKENFLGSIEETRFSPYPSSLDGSAHELLAPLPESNRLLASTEVENLSDFKRLTESLGRHITSDLKALDAVSRDASLIAKTASKLSKAAHLGSELLPYVGIAATGYALARDVESGKWIDGAFDGAALALQLLEVAQPELIPFLEPIILADLGAQWVVDKFRGPGVPPPAELDLKQVWEDYDQWLEAPRELADLRYTEGAHQVANAVTAVQQSEIIPALDARLEADLAILEKIASTFAREIHRQAVRAAGGEITGEQRSEVEPYRVTAIQELADTVDRVKRERTAAYAETKSGQARAMLDQLAAAWKPGEPGFDHFSTEFDNHVARPYITRLEERMLHHALESASAPISYLPDCLNYSPNSIDLFECLHFYREVLHARSLLEMYMRYEAMLVSRPWGETTWSYVIGEEPKQWLEPPVPTSTGKVCAKQMNYSSDGWQRANVELCAQKKSGSVVYSVTAHAEYYWGLGWHENASNVRLDTKVTVRKGGRSVASHSLYRLTEPYCNWLLGCSPTHPEVNGSVSIPNGVGGGLVISFESSITGMYWSTTTSPGKAGPSDISPIKQSVYLPAAP